LATLMPEPPSTGNNASAGQFLANRTVEAFAGLRSYLLKVEPHLEELHPQLCRNPGLVACLAAWKESLALGARYLRSSPLLGALSNASGEVWEAQGIAPMLVQLCENCDAELFLVLPRLVWLCFLAEPGSLAELIRHLLPHRFAVESTTMGGSASPAEACLGPELRIATGSFRRAEERLRIAMDKIVAGANDSERTWWHLLVRRAVGGMSSSDSLYNESCAPAQRQEVVEIVEGLMHEIERWSMELQRHSPEDWNACSNILVQCLSEVPQRPR